MIIKEEGSKEEDRQGVDVKINVKNVYVDLKGHHQNDENPRSVLSTSPAIVHSFLGCLSCHQNVAFLSLLKEVTDLASFHKWPGP